MTLFPTDVQACPGDNVTFNCVTDNGGLKWDVDNILEFFNQQTQNSRRRGIFYLQLVSINGSIYTSSATATGILPEHNGTTISCFDVKDNVMSGVINVLGLLFNCLMI